MDIRRSLPRFLITAVLACLGIVLAAGAQVACGSETFFVNGKQVSAGTYQAYAFVNSAVAAMKKNQIGAAIADLKHALAIEPTLSDAHGMLGVALARAGSSKEAADEFQMAIAGNPQSVSARLNLASLYQTTGNLKDALSSYERFISDLPQSNQVPAVKERIKLLQKEIDREEKSGSHDDNRYDVSDYFGNISEGGAKRWPDSVMPLAVFISPGEGLNGYSPDYQRILEESFREWEKDSRGKVRFQFCKSPEQADITCEWVDDPQQLASSAEGGEAEVRCLGGAICKAHMVLSVMDAGSAFPLTNNLVRILCLHEIGHSLGLLGHSARAQDIMFCTSPIMDKERHVSRADANTLNVLYEKPLDQGSQLLAQLEKQTHGNAVQVIRLVIIVVCIFVSAVAAIAALARSITSKRRRKKPRT